MKTKKTREQREAELRSMKAKLVPAGYEVVEAAGVRIRFGNRQEAADYAKKLYDSGNRIFVAHALFKRENGEITRMFMSLR